MIINNMAIFPYCDEMYPILESIQFMKKVNLMYIISLKGYGLIGKTVKAGNKEWKIQEEIGTRQYENIDTVWITDIAEKLEDSVLLLFIQNVVEKNINIIVTAKLMDKTKRKIMKFNDKYHSQIEFWDKDTFADSKFEKNMQIDVPIIVVFGIGEMTQKLKLQIYLQNYFGRSFKICQIGTRNDCKMLGMYSVPSFMFTKEYNETEKICKFNHWIKKLECENKPDVIIIGIPGSIMPLNEKHTFDYGILAYEIFAAIKPDYSIMTLYAGKYTDQFYEEMKMLCKYRYNFDVDSFYISRYSPMSNSMNDEILNYVEVSDIDDNNNDYKVFTSNALESSYLYDEILQKLEVYSMFESI